MRWLAALLTLFLASGPALSQVPAPAKKPAARQIDDAKARQHLEAAQSALHRGDYPAAEAAALQLLQENIRLFGADHANVGTALSLLGAAHLRMGKFPEAEGDFRRMLAIYERRLGPNHEDTAAALNSLALVLERQGDNPGAESLLRRAVGILERKFGRDHANTATVTSNLARVLDSQGKFAASSEGMKPPSVQQAARPGAGGDASQLAARAEEATRRGEFGEAETLHHQVLAIHEKTLGPEHPTTATSMSNLGRVLDLQGKYEDAEKVYRRVLLVREKVLGGDHPDVATSLNNLAKVLQELGRDRQATVSEARARARRRVPRRGQPGRGDVPSRARHPGQVTRPGAPVDGAHAQQSRRRARAAG